MFTIYPSQAKEHSEFWHDLEVNQFVSYNQLLKKVNVALVAAYQSYLQRQQFSATMISKDSKVCKKSVCSRHVTYAFQSESTLYSCLNLKELLARSRHEIWRLSDCSWTRTHNHLVYKRTLKLFSQTGQTDHLAKLSQTVFVYELSGSGFESSCSHFNFHICSWRFWFWKIFTHLYCLFYLSSY